MIKETRKCLGKWLGHYGIPEVEALAIRIGRLGRATMAALAYVTWKWLFRGLCLRTDFSAGTENVCSGVAQQGATEPTTTLLVHLFGSLCARTSHPSAGTFMA